MNREWGSGCALLLAPAPETVEVRHGGAAGGVCYHSCSPLPLTPPSSHIPQPLAPLPPSHSYQQPLTPLPPPNSYHVSVEKVVGKVCHGRLKVLPLVLDSNLLLLCYSSEVDTLYVGQLSARNPSEGKKHYKTFEKWSRAKGALVYTPLKCYQMPEEIQLLDFEVVGGVGYLCITCTAQLLICEIPLAASSLSCGWLSKATTYNSPSKISHSKLSPYTAGQVLVATERGGLCVYQKDVEVRVIRESCRADGEIGTGMCLYGAHPQHIIWLEEGRLYSSDLRTDKLPLPAVQQAMDLGEGAEVMCIGKGEKPFHVLVGTRTQFMLLDVRQPAEPLLTVPHHLVAPPLKVTTIQTSNNGTCLVFGSSSGASVAFSYAWSSPVSSVMVYPPHVVCELSDLLKTMKHSELHALCSQVGSRLKQPIIGSDILTVPSSDTYSTIVLTAVGDVMYQCWHYSSSPWLCTTTPPLTESQYLGLSLWLKQAHAQRKPQVKQSRITTKDLTEVSKYLFSGASREVSTSDGSLQSQELCELAQLKALYEELVPSSKLDTTIVTDWGRCKMEEMFNEEFCESSSNMNKVGDS